MVYLGCRIENINVSDKTMPIIVCILYITQPLSFRFERNNVTEVNVIFFMPLLLGVGSIKCYCVHS